MSVEEEHKMRAILRVRKSICLLLCALLVISMAACDGSKPTKRNTTVPGSPKNDVTPTAEATPTGEVTPEATPTGEVTPEATPTAEPSAEPTPTGAATPTTAPTATPTTAATATPTPLPLPEPLPEIDDYMCDRPNKALLAFAEYLDEKCWELAEGVDLHYGLCFINSDETPELWWAEGAAHVDTVTVCMYDGEGVKELGSYGEFGTFTYMPKCHTIVSTYAGMGQSWTSVNLLNGTEIITAFEFLRSEIDTGSGPEIHYYVNEDECSQKDYEDRYNAWQIDKYTTVGYGDGISVFEGEYIEHTTYTGLFNKYLSFYSTNPFKFVVPEDILESLGGVWIAQYGEVEGWEFDCEKEGIERRWEFMMVGEQQVVDNSRGVMPAVNAKFTPAPKWDHDPALYPWVIEFEDQKHPGYYFTLWMHHDQTLYEVYWSGEDKYACQYAYWKKQ